MNRSTTLPWWTWLAALLLLVSSLLFVPLVHCRHHFQIFAMDWDNPEEYLHRYGSQTLVFQRGKLVAGHCDCCEDGRRVSVYRRWSWQAHQRAPTGIQFGG